MEQTYQRKRCPFYGFHQSNGVYRDSKGNQCALRTDTFSPCVMETSGDPIDWDSCPLLADDIGATIKARADGKFYPNEKPNGISELEWMAEIDKIPKP